MTCIQIVVVQLCLLVYSCWSFAEHVLFVVYSETLRQSVSELQAATNELEKKLEETDEDCK